MFLPCCWLRRKPAGNLHDESILMKRVLAVISLLQYVLVVNVYAHHGKNFLVTGSFEIPRAGSWHALFAADFRNRFGTQAYEIEPGVLYGINNRLDVELHAHGISDDGAFHAEAIAVESRFSLFGQSSGSDREIEEEHGRVGVTLLLEFEKGLNDQPDAYEVRMIVGAERGDYQLAGNLIWQQALRSTLMKYDMLLASGERSSAVSASAWSSMEVLINSLLRVSLLAYSSQPESSSI